MKVFTQADFETLARDDNGFLHLQSGDWSNVNFNYTNALAFAYNCRLGNNCKLGKHCKLDKRCTLGDNCTLGKCCELGSRCTLGDGCILGDRCIFGDRCTLGDRCILDNCCTLGDYCILGYDCMLGARCTLGTCCTLGDYCTLGDDCELENGAVKNATFFKVSNIGSRSDTAYCYCNTMTGAVYVRAGCWFSGVDDFIKRVRQVYAGARHEKDYLAMAEFAKMRFAQYRAEE